ncbi:hypothetical protein D3C71_585920 [compost metagenome]
MCYKKYIGRAIIILVVLLSILSCKKLDKKNPIEFTIQAHIPYSGEPISGVRYTIKEYRSKKGGGIGEIEYTDFELEGVTNASGIAEISFFPKKKLDYMYRIYFDYSNIQFESYSGSYSLINAPSYDIMTRSDQKDYEIRALPLLQINYKLENVNCSGVSDSMRIIIRNYDEEYYLDFNNETWSPYNIGCYIETSTIQAKSGRYMYKIQIKRNGNLTEYIDTILIAPGVNDNLFIEY